MKQLLLFLLLGLPAAAQPSQATIAANGAATVAWLKAHMYIRELTGRNDHPEIDQWARENGNALRSEWCGLTQYAAQKACKLPWPKAPAGSYNWFQRGVRLVFQVGSVGSVSDIQVGFKTGVYSLRLRRVAHIMAVGAIVRGLRPSQPPRGFYTYAGNEGSGTRAGLHYTYYPAASIYASANWSYNIR